MRHFEFLHLSRRRFLNHTAAASVAVVTPAAFAALDSAKRPASAGDLISIADFGAKGDGVTDDRKAIAAADGHAGSVNGIVTFPAGSFVVGSNLTLTSPVVLLPGAVIAPADGVALTINGSFDAGSGPLFAGRGNVVFGAGSLLSARASWWGFASRASDVENATKLQAAIDSNAPRVLLPAGDFSFNAGIKIDRVMELSGCGSCGAGSDATGFPGVSTTRLIYTGSIGAAITLVGSGIEGKENIHLRDFSLWGNARCAGGIRVGSAVMISKCSLRNVHVRGFSAQRGYGVSFERVLESLCENVYSQFNYDGFVSPEGGVCTTTRFVNCHSRSNARHGTYLAGMFSGCSALGLLSEGNGAAGLRIEGNGVVGTDFISYYSEANNRTTGTAPIEIGKSALSAPTHVNFIGGYLADAVAGLSIDIDRGEMIAFSDMALTSYNPGFMRVTSNSVAVVFRTAVANCRPGSVSGNALGRVRIDSGGQPAQFEATIVEAGTIALPLRAGLVLITDTTNAVSAMFSLNASLHTVTEWLDPGGKFSAISGTPNSINVAYANGYFVQNMTGGAISILVAVLNTDYMQ